MFGQNDEPKPKQDVVYIHYIQFDAETYFPQTYESLKKMALTAVVSYPYGVKIIHAALNRRLCKGIPSTLSVRMIARLNGEEYVVDSQGCVKKGKESYYIYPSAFLTLFNVMAEGEAKKKP